ncbi:MAG: tetratricopeptide repeat protein [Bdellovibrionota bacterium]
MIRTIAVAIKLAQIHLEIDESKGSCVRFGNLCEKSQQRCTGELFCSVKRSIKANEETEAKKYIETSASQDPNNAQAQLLLGLISLKQDKFSDAKNYFNRAVNLEPNTAKAYYGLGQVAAKERKNTTKL